MGQTSKNFISTNLRFVSTGAGIQGKSVTRKDSFVERIIEKVEHQTRVVQADALRRQQLRLQISSGRQRPGRKFGGRKNSTSYFSFFITRADQFVGWFCWKWLKLDFLGNDWPGKHRRQALAEIVETPLYLLQYLGSQDNFLQMCICAIWTGEPVAKSATLNLMIFNYLEHHFNNAQPSNSFTCTLWYCSADNSTDLILNQFST